MYLGSALPMKTPWYDLGKPIKLGTPGWKVPTVDFGARVPDALNFGPSAITPIAPPLKAGVFSRFPKWVFPVGIATVGLMFLMPKRRR